MALCSRRTGLGALIGLVAIGIAVAGGRVRRFEIAEHSMEPELKPGDYVIALKRRGPRRGQIVIFELPGVPHFDVAKRIVGLGGERIQIANGQLHIDGAVLAEPWADGPTHSDGEWQVGAHQLFVLGDSRARSSGDSRTLGPIGAATATWRVVWRYWPPRRAGRL